MIFKSAYIEITNVCNLNCSTCYNRSGNNLKVQELSFKELDKIFDALVNKYQCERILLAGGEPTLHSRFGEVLALKEKYDSVSFGIVTNGTVYSQPLMDSAVSGRNVDIQVSLDGSCEEINSKTRGAGNFIKAIEFIKKIKTDTHMPIIKMVVSQNNIDDIEDFYRMTVALGCVPEFAFINNTGNAKDDWENKIVSAKQKLKVLKLIDKLNNELDINAFLPFCTSNCPLSDVSEPYTIAIKCDGAVVPCQLLYDKKFEVGNILYDDTEIFTEGFEKISEMVTARKNTDYGCGSCILKNHCQKGCMALAEYTSGEPLACDGDCDYRKLQILGYDLAKQNILA